jgi:hypothetical protein
MRDICAINVLYELIDDSRSIIDNSRKMLQLVASFMIVIYDSHIFIVQATAFCCEHYKTFFTPSMRLSTNKLECLLSASLFSLV